MEYKICWIFQETFDILGTRSDFDFDIRIFEYLMNEKYEPQNTIFLVFNKIWNIYCARTYMILNKWSVCVEHYSNNILSHNFCKAIKKVEFWWWYFMCFIGQPALWTQLYFTNFMPRGICNKISNSSRLRLLEEFCGKVSL